MMYLKKQSMKSTNPLTNSPAFNSLRPVDLRNFTKEEVKAYFNNTYDLYETLFASIKNDLAYYLCPDRLRLPLIFYYGHTAAVYVNKLVLSGLLKPSERINLDYEATFETGVDEMSWDDIEHYRMGGDYKWPTVEETREYRLKVRKLINDLIDRTPLELPVTMESQWWALLLGIEHEHIHFETSTVLIRQYPIDMVSKPNGWIYGPTRSNKTIDSSQNHMIKVEETKLKLGKKYEFPSFGFDNEYAEPQLEVTVSAFEASKFKVTNEQFLEFVLSNGYQTREYWCEEGWQWVQFKQAKHPLFWVCPKGCKSGCGGAIASYSHCKASLFSDDELKYFPDSNNKAKKSNALIRINSVERNSAFGYKLRLMFDVVQMPMNWPVEVNYHEAKAYCKWKGEDYRVLSEAEHFAIRDYIITDLNPMNDIIFKKNSKVNHNMLYGSSTPVDLNPSNSKGFNDVFGNVWEWTEDHFNALPGNKTHYLYDDFSSPCYDGRHNIIMGGSWASAGDVASYFARYMFRRHFYQHCGFRLARSIPTGTLSKPNPQIRLVADRIFLLGSGFPDYKVNLNGSKLMLSYHQTANDQYLYDSHLHPELAENELLYEYEASEWFKTLIEQINSSLKEHNISKGIATHLGASTGRITFELTKMFDEVVGIDYSSKLLDYAIKLQSDGLLETKLETKSNKSIKIDIRTNLSAAKAIFKQMTWLPNEVPKSNFVLFTMIDRVTNHLSWLKRLREIVNYNSLAMIYSRNSKWTSKNLLADLQEDFDLVNELSISANDTLTIWKMKKDYELFF